MVSGGNGEPTKRLSVASVVLRAFVAAAEPFVVVASAETVGAFDETSLLAVVGWTEHMQLLALSYVPSTFVDHGSSSFTI